MVAKTTAQAKAENQKKPKVITKPKQIIKTGVVKKPVKKVTKKKAAPKKPVITIQDFEQYYYSLNKEMFTQLAKKWNEQNLRIKIPKLDGYDHWLNYFSQLSPTVIKQLAKTGVDFLPTEAYSALSRWHDIILHPSRIDKIHQSGLNIRQEKGKKSILQLAQSNDRLGVLKATRDKLAEKLEKGAGSRDTAALAREMTEVMTQIADYEKRMGPKKTTKLGQLLGDIDLRKRPAHNGNGARHTSFKSRVTISDLEGAK